MTASAPTHGALPSDGPKTESFSPTVKIRPYGTKNYSDMAIRSILLDARESGDMLESFTTSVFHHGGRHPTVAVLNADKRLVVKLLFPRHGRRAAMIGFPHSAHTRRGIV